MGYMRFSDIEDDKIPCITDLVVLKHFDLRTPYMLLKIIETPRLVLCMWVTHNLVIFLYIYYSSIKNLLQKRQCLKESENISYNMRCTDKVCYPEYKRPP